jgi:ribulose bisphosphate carboxylase small subunit
MSFYIPPAFLDKLSLHITKNFLSLPNVKVPLILGIHGRKGEGKSFMCELVYRRMGIGVVYMSGGELESPDAGDPARLIRLRYREAGEWSRTHGRMAVLMINDLDAGAGRFDQATQYTVNTQLVNATLMNIADHPTNVQLPGSYDENPTQRIPIIATGNDFSTLYAPLVRDGRMEKYYWEPAREDRIGIVSGIFEVDAVAHRDIEQLVDAFPWQAIDFFGAIRARLYDEQVLRLIHEVGVEKISQRVVNSTEALPEFYRPDFSLPHLIATGQQLLNEQEQVQAHRLAMEYNPVLDRNRPPGTPSGTPRQESGGAAGDRYFIRYDEGNGQSAPAASPVPESHTLSPEMVATIRQTLGQGHRLGIEHVDRRRFQTGAWQCYSMVDGSEQEAIALLQTCLADHPQDYIRLVSIEPQERRRVQEAIVHRP